MMQLLTRSGEARAEGPLKQQLAITLLTCLLLAPSAVAQTTQSAISASIGFSGVFKPDSWVPIYVRVSDGDAPRSATLEVRTARSKLGHEVVARVATTRQPTTYTLYAPLGGLDGASLQLRDATGKLLGSVDLTGAVQQTSAANGGPVFGVAGAEADAQRLVNQLVNDTGEFAAAGILPTQLLPERVIGYSGIDCLVLPSLEPNSIGDEVQAAIVAWVRSGGIVITWPSAQAPSRPSPLVDALPADVGLPKEFAFEGTPVVGRKLTIRGGASSLDAAGAAESLILQRRLGLGQIVMLAFDPTRLSLSATARVALWRRLTSGQMAMSPDDERAGVFDPLVAQAVGEQQLSLPPAESRVSMRTLLGVGLLIGLLLGPAELLLLAAARRHPRTWYTMTGVGLTFGCGVAFVLWPVRAIATAPRIDVRVEAPDGLAASAALTAEPSEGMAATWLTGGAEPLAQMPSELELHQKAEHFDVRLVSTARGPAAKLRAVRFAGETLHPPRINTDLAASLVTNRSPAAWDAYAVVSRNSVRLLPDPLAAGDARSFATTPTIAADDPSTRRVETGVERLASTAGWGAILMDGSLAERVVRLLETEETQLIVARSTAPDGSVAFTLQVIR